MGGDGPGRRRTDDDLPGARRSARGAARSICVIGAFSGLATLLSTFVPGPADLALGAVRTVAVVTLALSGLLVLLPWHRVPRAVTLAFVPLALALIGMHNTLSAQDAYRYGVFFLALFVWIGLWHPRWTSLAVAPLAALAYVVPLLWGQAPAYAPWTVVYALPVYVVVGEVIARRSAALAEAVARLERLARTDPLTELPNRTVLQRELAAADAHGALVYLDVDDFKTVNDTLGHAGGDQVLRHVADALRSSVREGDLPLRIAGDEFAVLLAGPVSAEEATTVTRRIRDRLATVQVGGRPVRTSIGVAWRDGDEAERLLGRADAAMYEAKQSGRDRVVLLGAPA